MGLIPEDSTPPAVVVVVVVPRAEAEASTEVAVGDADPSSLDGDSAGSCRKRSVHKRHFQVGDRSKRRVVRGVDGDERYDALVPAALHLQAPFDSTSMARRSPTQD